VNRIDMRRTLLLCAIGVSLLVAVVAWSQSAGVDALPGLLKDHLQSEQFATVTSIRGLPLGVRQDLEKMFGSGMLDIAEPGAEFQGAGVAATPQLPTRRLIAAGCAADHHCLMYYERGGTAAAWHVMLFQWTPDATRFEWGGNAPRGLETIEDVRKALLSGSIKNHTGPW
jgi:hypothetical protein